MTGQSDHGGAPDLITGYDRFFDRCRQAIAMARRRRLTLAVATLEIDDFDRLSGELGLDAAELGPAVARRLKESVREEDAVALVGSHELALLLPGVAGPLEAASVMENVARAFQRPVFAGLLELKVTFSTGLAIFPPDGGDAAELFYSAEVARRRSASGSAGGWQFFHESMNAEREERAALADELREAISGGELELYFQPILDAKSGAVSAVEALLRWQHPRRGLTAPLDFIPLAEEAGLMDIVDEWVLSTACRQAESWGRQLGRPLRVAVNLSAGGLHKAELSTTVTEVLGRTGLHAELLDIEITESAITADATGAGRALAELRRLGAGVTLDDFGTGLSSLHHVISLPFTSLKVDRVLVREAPRAKGHAAAIAALVTLGARLGITVVGEGVETESELDFLRREGCDAVQGHALARPQPADEMGRLLGATGAE